MAVTSLLSRYPGLLQLTQKTVAYQADSVISQITLQLIERYCILDVLNLTNALFEIIACKTLY